MPQQMLSRLSLARFLCAAASSLLVAAIAGTSEANARGVIVTAIRSHGTIFARKPSPPASVYTYDGVIYDRLFADRSPAHGALGKLSRHATVSSPPGTPYAITDLEAAMYARSGISAYGAPVGVNDLGQIAYYDECQCFSGEDFSNGNAGLTIDDTGDLFGILSWVCCEEGESTAIPYVSIMRAIRQVNTLRRWALRHKRFSSYGD